jgi:hypothetical protein
MPACTGMTGGQSEACPRAEEGMNGAARTESLSTAIDLNAGIGKAEPGLRKANTE